MSMLPPGRRLPERRELPTWAVAIAIYALYLGLTWNFTILPLWLAAPSLAVVLTWHGSLQHETIHGHPTRWRRVNAVVGWAPLALWLPYSIYRETHLRHHAEGGRDLTVPGSDPESHYLPAGTAACRGWIVRTALHVNQTLAGRLVLGPAIVVLRCWADQLRQAPERRRSAIWARHAIGVGVVLLWVVGVCRISPALYIAAVVYPSLALTLLRSFAEHRTAPDPRHRTAVVEAHPFWALLFLNNQLHLAHHAKPNLAWYRLPRAWREMAPTADVGEGLLFPGGYAEIAGKYLFRPFITAEHPAPGK